MPEDPCRVLIIECGPDRLLSDGITLAREFAEAARGCANTYLDEIEARSRRELHERLRALDSYYDIVVIVGHANKDVLGLSAGQEATWQDVGKWLSEVEPETVLIAGCEAGRTLATRSLFDEISDLEEVFGAAGRVTPGQLQILKALLSTLILKPDVSDDVLHLFQVGNAALTKGLIFWQTRDGYADSDDSKDVLWDGVETWIQKLIGGQE
jgi:hypothetical protein